MFNHQNKAIPKRGVKEAEYNSSVDYAVWTYLRRQASSRNGAGLFFLKAMPR
jgi:hypothetical protein